MMIPAAYSFLDTSTGGAGRTAGREVRARRRAAWPTTAGWSLLVLGLHAGALAVWFDAPLPPQPLPMTPFSARLISPQPTPETSPEPPLETAQPPQPPQAVEPPAPEPPAPPSAPVALTPNATLPPPKPQPAPARPKPQTKPKPQPRTPPKPRPLPSAAQSAPVAQVAAAPQRSEADEPVQAVRFDAAYLRNPAPPYPVASRRAGEAGRVLLSVRVSAAGLAEAVSVMRSSGYPRLDESALSTVRRWRFVPANRGGQAVAASVIVPINFKLEQNR